MGKKKGSDSGPRAAKGSPTEQPSSLPKGAVGLALVALVGGVCWYYAAPARGAGNDDGAGNSASLLQQLEEEATDTASVTVRFKDAGVRAKHRQPFEEEVVLSQADFVSYSNHSSFFESRNGRRLKTWTDVVKEAKALGDGERLVVLQGPAQDKPSSRHFVWPTNDVGHRVEVADVPVFDKEQPIEIETLSLNPKVFYVKNFMSSDEADALVAKATASDNPYSIRPSTVGHKAWTQGEGMKNTDSTRTSENGFDVNSPTAMRLKRRAWELLRLSGNYDEAMVDGFQVLRYELKQAYIAHMDSFPFHTSQDHNWDPSKGGTNRFATLLVYLSDVDEGGQTVFPKVPAAEPAPVPESAAGLFQAGTWQKSMVQDCYSKLSVQPKKGNAILFYSQTDGKINNMALHGGCPVLNGTKWAANLWFWNQCRYSQCEKRHLKAGVKISEEHLVKR